MARIARKKPSRCVRLRSSCIYIRPYYLPLSRPNAFYQCGGIYIACYVQGVPKFDGLVAGRRYDLAIIGRERNRHDVVCVANEATGGSARVQIPKSQSLVPGSGENELTVG